MRANRIAVEMAAKGYTLDDLEAFTGIPASRLEKIKYGVVSPTLEEIMAIAEALDVDPYDLFPDLYYVFPNLVERSDPDNLDEEPPLFDPDEYYDTRPEDEY